MLVWLAVKVSGMLVIYYWYAWFYLVAYMSYSGSQMMMAVVWGGVYAVCTAPVMVGFWLAWFATGQQLRKYCCKPETGRQLEDVEAANQSQRK